MKMNIGIIFGGRSGEHEISVRSATAVIENIDKSKYTVIPIAISAEGKWLSPAASLALFPGTARDAIGDGAVAIAERIALVGDTAFPGLTVLESSSRASSTPLDVVFPVLHGTFGEDGTIQGLLEMADIPYVGCGVLASSCGMDKVVMKKLFADAGLPICKYLWFLRSDWESNADAVIRGIEGDLGYPCFVKPANLGSSVGVSRADDAACLRAAIDLAAEFDRKIIVEESLDMREIECAVMGNDQPQASLPGEYIIHDKNKKFLDYTEKYDATGNNEFVVPAPISDELSEKIRELAVRAFTSIDGSGLARVDFFLRRDNGMLLVNEINTMPGLTNASGFPKMWAGTGKPFTAVIDELVEFAFERHRDRSRNKTSRLN
jgi:D-alanine-D-alanine ligase